MRIRPSTPDDGQRVIEIWRGAVHATHDFLAPQDLAEIDSLVCDFLPKTPLWIAIDDTDETVGFMGMTENGIDALFIDRTRRGSGIGRLMIDYARSLHPVLTVDVNEQNAQAVGFCERMGFVRTGRSPVDGQGRPYPLIHMRSEGASVADGKTRAELSIRVDDLSGPEIHALVKRHLAGMHENSPPESVHAFDLEKLRHPGVTFWSGWVGGEIAAMGALKRLDAANGEIKSMRVADPFLGKGAGRAMLEHIVAEARRIGIGTLWLETGSAPAFDPALKLYQRAGFSYCGPFGDYKEDPFSRFMVRRL